MEIEVRAFIKDIKELRKLLMSIESDKIDETEIEDIWLCRKDIDNYKDTKMNNVGSYGLRFRLQKGRANEITVKTIVSEGDHQIFDESETCFDDMDQMKKIFDIIGFKVFCILRKKRETFQFRNMKINLEEIENFPPCVEIEIMDDGNFDSNKDRIHEVFDLLNIDNKDRIDTSITSLFMEKNAFR